MQLGVENNEAPFCASNAERAQEIAERRVQMAAALDTLHCDTEAAAEPSLADFAQAIAESLKDRAYWAGLNNFEPLWQFGDDGSRVKHPDYLRGCRDIQQRMLAEETVLSSPDSSSPGGLNSPLGTLLDGLYDTLSPCSVLESPTSSPSPTPPARDSTRLLIESNSDNTTTLPSSPVRFFCNNFLS
jgi:hypothetical protein